MGTVAESPTWMIRNRRMRKSERSLLCKDARIIAGRERGFGISSNGIEIRDGAAEPQ